MVALTKANLATSDVGTPSDDNRYEVAVDASGKRFWKPVASSSTTTDAGQAAQDTLIESTRESIRNTIDAAFLTELEKADNRWTSDLLDDLAADLAARDVNEGAITAAFNPTTGNFVIGGGGQTNTILTLPEAPEPTATEVSRPWLKTMPTDADAQTYTNGWYLVDPTIDPATLNGLWEWDGTNQVQIASLSAGGTTIISGEGITVQSGWSAQTNAQVDRQFDANNTTSQEMADVIATTIEDLKSAGVFSE